MNRQRNDVVVGLAVVLVVVALLGGLAWVERMDLGGHKHEVVARVRDVENTRVGDAVVIRGVVAGNIQAIELAPGGWVHLRMRIDRAVELPPDPVVVLNESSLFGEWQAAIVERSALPVDESLQHAVADASGERGVLPGAALPGIGALTAVAGQIAGNVAKVAGRVQTAFDDQAAREVRASIKNVSDLSSVLAGAVRAHASDLDTVANQLRVASTSIAHTAAVVQRLAERADTSATSGDVKHIVENVAAASADLRSATREVNALTARFTTSESRLDDFLINGDSILVKVNAGRGSLGMLVNDPSLYRRGDSVLTQLDALIRDIRANPSRYVRLHIF